MDWITALAAFLIAILSGMGMGSAGLLVVYLTMVEQVPQLTAQGINLVFFLFSASAALCVHALRRKIPFSRVILASAAGIIGALPGVWAAEILPQNWVRVLFGVMLIVSGLRTFFTKSDKIGKTPKKSPRNN